MQFRSWIWLSLPALLGGRLQGQEHVGTRVGFGGEWSTIPGRADREGIAGGVWGISATLEIVPSAIPSLAFVTRAAYTPKQLSPAAPQMTAFSGGVRLALLRVGRVTASTSVEVEGLYFGAEGAAAYDAAVGPAGARLGEHYYPGWRGGMRLSPALELWAGGPLWFRLAPAIRWLGPVGHGGPAGDEAYVTFELDVLSRLPRLPGGSVQAEGPRAGVRLGLAGEWSTIPGRADRAGVADALWGGSATVEIRHPAILSLALVTRLGYVPGRLTPAAPQMTTIAGGVRLPLATLGPLSASASLEVEGVYFGTAGAAAYNEAVGVEAGWFVERERYYPGWRGGMRLSPALEFWPTGVMGVRFAPALRWLGPIGEGGPLGNATYWTFDLGVLWKVRP